MTNTINIIMPKTKEEIEAVNAMLLEMRAKKEHEILVEKCKMAISFDIADAVNKIGLAETKFIVRELARELRTFSDTESK